MNKNRKYFRIIPKLTATSIKGFSYHFFFALLTNYVGIGILQYLLSEHPCCEKKCLAVVKMTVLSALLWNMFYFSLISYAGWVYCHPFCRIFRCTESTVQWQNFYIWYMPGGWGLEFFSFKGRGRPRFFTTW